MGDRVHQHRQRAGEPAMSLIRVDAGDGFARITLDDPARRNILSGPLVAELTAAFDGLEGDDGVTAVVLTGSGPAFCAGADLGDLLAAADGDPAGVHRVYGGFDRVRRSPLVTIAAVNGPAVGAGLNLALVCDIRVAGTSAWFDCRFPALGLHPGGANLLMLRQLVGSQTAAAMALCRWRLDADQARVAGLVLETTNDEELLATAEGLARAAAATPRELVLLTKRSLREEQVLTVEEAMALEEERQMWSLRLPATVNGLRAAARRSR
jgi:enoyl-CoA hydratase